MRIIAVASFVLLLACERGPSKLDQMGGGGEIESKDILARTKTSPEVQVKHVLIGWKDLEQAYGGRMDPRAKARTKEDAEKLARDIASKLRQKPDSIDALVKQYSEDPGSLRGKPY